MQTSSILIGINSKVNTQIVALLLRWHLVAKINFTVLFLLEALYISVVSDLFSLIRKYFLVWGSDVSVFQKLLHCLLSRETKENTIDLNIFLHDMAIESLHCLFSISFVIF